MAEASRLRLENSGGRPHHLRDWKVECACILAFNCAVPLPSFRKLGASLLVSMGFVAWCLTSYELWQTAGAMLWLDLLCAGLLATVVVTGAIWLRRLRLSEPRGWPGWSAVFAFFGSAALVWTGRPFLAEIILITKHDVVPMKQHVKGLPKVISAWLMRQRLHPTEATNWSSGEGLSRRKLASSEELLAAMRLLAVCKPRVFTLSCSQLSDFRPLNELRGLEQLYLYGTIQPDAPLPHLPNVRELRTGGCKFTDFRAVAAIAPNATVLRVNESSLHDVNISGLQKLPQLQHLDIRYCKVIGAGMDEILQRIPRVQQFHDWGTEELR